LVQHTFGYYHVGIGLIENDEVVYRAGAGKLWDDPAFEFKPQRLKVGKEGITGWVAAHGQPALVPDVAQDPRYVWMQMSGTRSEVVVPLFVQDHVIGVLDVQSDQVNAFDTTDLTVLEAIARQVGAAIENARLYARAQELAVMQERNRLARDLHDAVTQTLFSASLLADALPASWDKNPAEGRQLANELRQLTRGALAEMRTLLLELRPAALVETKLGDLLRQLADAVAGRAALAIHVAVDGDCKLPAEAHIAFYRIAQEALNNVAKHARATQVTLSLVCRESAATLRVQDDGRGFEPAQVSAARIGLASMRERAQAIGATFELESAPGKGACIQVAWGTLECAE
jgi:signal transduction histidine kinase